MITLNKRKIIPKLYPVCIRPSYSSYDATCSSVDPSIVDDWWVSEGDTEIRGIKLILKAHLRLYHLYDHFD